MLSSRAIRREDDVVDGDVPLAPRRRRPLELQVKLREVHLRQVHLRPVLGPHVAGVVQMLEQ